MELYSAPQFLSLFAVLVILSPPIPWRLRPSGSCQRLRKSFLDKRETIFWGSSPPAGGGRAVTTIYQATYSGVAQRQSSRLLIYWSWVRSPPPEPTMPQQKCPPSLLELRTGRLGFCYIQGGFEVVSYLS